MTGADAASLPRVVLCGPIAADGEAARGGYQACNRRTIAALRERGVDVVPLPYPHPRSLGWRKWLAYATGFLGLYRRAALLPSGSIFHVTALAGHFLYNELPLVQLARLRGCKVVLDLRAGAGQTKYLRRGAVYQALFRSMLRQVDQVLVEGESMVDFIDDIAGVRPTWLPNHVDLRDLPGRTGGPAAAPTLAYVGRIVPEKGVEVLLQAARRLRDDGLGARVAIAGDGMPAYVGRLRRDFADVPTQWLGALPPAEVLRTFSEAHFFVFPTWHRGEGHSNALTEAMACGCVPIASRHGYNEPVIGDAGVTLALPAEPQAYANAVRRCWGDGSWAPLSALATRRAAQRFSTAAVMRTLLSCYARLAAGTRADARMAQSKG